MKKRDHISLFDHNIMAVFKINEKNRHVFIVLTIALVSVISIFDYWTGPNIEFGLIYLIPVIIGATIGRRFGLIISTFCALTGFASDVTLTRYPSEILHYLWDFGSHLVIYCFVALSRSKLLESRQYERELARKDSLTGVMNARAFYETIENEIYHMGRKNYSFSIVYIDVDNFKHINDTLGHSEGDRLLCVITGTIRKDIRMTDALARLGGDEFALALVDANHEYAQVAVGRICKNLLEEMQKNNWPVTFSVGVITCQKEPPSVDALVKMADDLMYSVKNFGKNSIKYSVYSG